MLSRGQGSLQRFRLIPGRAQHQIWHLPGNCLLVVLFLNIYGCSYRCTPSISTTVRVPNELDAETPTQAIPAP